MSSISSSPSDAEKYRQNVYEIRSRNTETSLDVLEDLLALGCEYFGVTNGHVKRIDQETETHEVIASHGGGDDFIPGGDIHEHGTTYCRITIDRETPFSIEHAAEQGFEDDPAYREHGLDCYLGVPFSLGGTRYGTVCFVDENPRSEPFSADERSFAELLARTVSQELTGSVDEDGVAVKTRALENASVAISIADATTDPARFSYVNKRFEQLTGYDRETVLGEDFRSLRGPQTSEVILSELKTSLEADDALQDELCLYRRDGSYFWVRLSATPVTDTRGETTHYVVFYQDITQRRRNERLLAVLNRVLRHNVRNRLSIVDGYARKLADAVETTDPAPREKISAAIEDLVELSHTAKTLEKCRKDAEQAGRIDIVPVVTEVAQKLRDEAGDATVSVSVPDEQPVVATDRIRTALLELGENCLEHAGDEPTIELSVQALSEDNLVRICIGDDGPSLPEPDRMTLEGRPETPMEHGSGLGLFLVYWIVTSHGGYVTVSRDDGATVELFLRTTPTQPGEIPETVPPSTD